MKHSCCPLCMGAFARMYDLDADVLQRVLREFDLFCARRRTANVRSPYLDRVMAKLEERRMINVANGKKGGRPKRMESTPETPMDKGEKPNQNQKSREEERRVTTVVKDNNSSNEEKTEKENSAAAASDGLQIVSPPEDRDSCPYSRFFRGRCWWIRWPNRKVTWSRWLCIPAWANFSWSGRRR